MLREAHESIADKGGIIEDNERMMKFLNDEKEELTRENQVRLDPVPDHKRVALCYRRSFDHQLFFFAESPK